MSKDVVLTDYDGEQIMPITTADNVMLGDNLTLRQKLDDIKEQGGVTIDVDSELSETSNNPVKNKVITAKLNEVFQGTSNVLREKIWSNPNTSVAFPAQTINLDLSKYDYVEVEITDNITSDSGGIDTKGTAIKQITIGKRSRLSVDTLYDSWLSFRTVVVNNNGVTFEGGGYQYLNNTERANDNRYCIPINIYGVKIYSGSLENEYSLEEQRIGTWIDGKPLYQKTLECGELVTNNGDKRIIPTNLEMDTICDISGISMTADKKQAFKMQRISPLDQYTFGLDVMDNNIRIHIMHNLSTFTTTYVTLKYTKATDIDIN